MIRRWFFVGGLVIACGDPAVGGSQRVLRKDVLVDAPAVQVFAAWTTPERTRSFFGVDAQIELRRGGKYEIYFSNDAPAGQRGAEGCEVLSYVPNEMLSFTWNAPPSIPKLRESGARTHVVLQFEEAAPGKTLVRFAQLGFGEGEDWDKYYQYFDRAWGIVLAGLQKSFAKDPAVSPTSPADTWTTIGRLVGGEWRAQGTWEDPTQGGIKVVHEWGLDKRIIKTKSFILAPDGQEKLVYETVVGWHPGKQTAVFASFSASGDYYDGVMAVNDGAIEYDWFGYAKDKVTRYRQTVKFTNDNSYEWTVWQDKDGQWEKIKGPTALQRRP